MIVGSMPVCIVGSYVANKEGGCYVAFGMCATVTITAAAAAAVPSRLTVRHIARVCNSTLNYQIALPLTWTPAVLSSSAS